MHTHDGCVYHLDGSIMSGGKCVHDPPPYSGPSPPDETVVASGAWAIALRQIAPWCAGSQHPADAVENTSIVYTRHASRLVRQHWPDGRPFIICEFVTHHPTLLFGACKCASRTINQQRSIAPDANMPILLSLSGHSGHGRTRCWHVRGANDPCRHAQLKIFASHTAVLSPFRSMPFSVLMA